MQEIHRVYPVDVSKMLHKLNFIQFRMMIIFVLPKPGSKCLVFEHSEYLTQTRFIGYLAAFWTRKIVTKNNSSLTATGSNAIILKLIENEVRIRFRR